MADKSKKGKKGTISEEDSRNLLQRYSVNTVLGLLQEVEQAAGEKIDWHEVVKNTTTGISGAREYQMLWRHLAYGETLIDQLDQDAEPVDDDSDLEYEVEAFPAVSREASAEAAACVKVLIASGYPNDSHAPNNTTIEAPLTINIPSSKTASASSDNSLIATEIQGTNISIPVSVQKQPLSSGISGEKRPNDGAFGANLPSRRRRRSWSAEEDTKLTAAVQKHGERNWANIARWDFKNDRRASELSQRWTNLRKKQGNPVVNSKVGTSSQPSETLAATHRALSMALKMDNNLRTSQMNTDQQLGRAGPPKPQLLTNRPSMNPTPTADSMVKAAAVAAGARIATPADASSLIEAARSQNVVHITTGSSVMKSSTTGIVNQLPSNVHFIRNGLAKAPISTFSAPKPNISLPGEAKQAQNRSLKPVAPAAPATPAAPNPVGAAQVLNVASEKEKAVIPSTEPCKTSEVGVVSTLANEIKELPQSSQGAKPAESSSCAPVERVPEDQSAALSNQLEEAVKHQTSSSGNALKEKGQDDQPSVSISESTSQTTDDGVALPSSEVEDNGKTNTDNQIASEENPENPSSNGVNEDLPSTSVEGNANNPEA